MDIEANGIKGELNVEAKIDSKKIVSKHKSKHGDVIDKSTNQSAETIINGQVIQQNYQVILTDKQLGDIVGIAQDQIADSVKNELMKQSEHILKKAFEDVSPMFLATFASKDQSELQVNALVNSDIESAIRKQVIQVAGFLTTKDLELLGIINDVNSLLSNELTWLWSKNIEDLNFRIGTDAVKVKITDAFIRSAIEFKINFIKQKIEDFELKYGQIKFNDFENLKRNNVISNDGNTHKPVDELICKTFYKECNDKTKNGEYELENTSLRTKENRSKWTSWFSPSKFNGTFVEGLLNEAKGIVLKLPSRSYWNGDEDDLKMFYFVTQLGDGIIKSQKSLSD